MPCYTHFWLLGYLWSLIGALLLIIFTRNITAPIYFSIDKHVQESSEEKEFGTKRESTHSEAENGAEEEAEGRPRS